MSVSARTVRRGANGPTWIYLIPKRQQPDRNLLNESCPSESMPRILSRLRLLCQKEHGPSVAERTDLRGSTSFLNINNLAESWPTETCPTVAMRRILSSLRLVCQKEHGPSVAERTDLRFYQSIVCQPQPDCDNQHWKHCKKINPDKVIKIWAL